MNKINVKIINDTEFDLPEYGTQHSAGIDLRANISQECILEPGERKMFDTGIKIQLPEGYEAQIRPRSGMALKKGIYAHIGTIDSDYTGYIGVLLFNLGQNPVTIKPGDRIAQMVISEYTHVSWDVVDVLDQTERGEGGFGHTGEK